LGRSGLASAPGGTLWTITANGGASGTTITPPQVGQFNWRPTHDPSTSSR